MSTTPTTKHFIERRQHLCRLIGSGVALVPTAPEQQRNNDCNYPYRPDSYFLYLTGFEEPEAMLVLDADTGKSILFCRQKHIDQEIWNGFRYGPDAAREAFGFDEAYPIEEFEQRLPDFLDNRSQVHWGIGRSQTFDQTVARALNAVRDRARGNRIVPATFHDIATPLDAMRLVKDDVEIATLRRAGDISAQAHYRAMQTARPGLYEYQVEAEILHTFVRNGARWPSYESIVAGGANACTLHYVSNRAQLHDGELLLIDAGCELDGYAGDITRTFPINGRFSPAQRDVYQIVLAAELAAIDAIAPGVPWHVPADAALRVLVQGMLDLGLVQGTPDGVIESGAYKQFYMHGIGHWVGLDVHDVGGRYLNGEYRQYQPGMCTTVEPGLYIRPADGVPPALHNIGIRIEDNVLVTHNGHEVYTGGVPKQIADIEELMRG